jgi:predicted permease
MNGRRTVGPPRWTEAVLRASLSRAGNAGGWILGDLREEYAALARASSPGQAAGWYRREAAGIAARAAVDRVKRRGAFYDRRRAAGTAGRGGVMMGRWWNDVRHAARALGRARQFTVVSALTLALAIGANAAVFAVIDSVLLEPLPYPGSERLVGLWHTAPGLGYDQFGISAALFYVYRDRRDLFEESGFYRTGPVNLTGEGESPDRVEAGRVMRTVFGTLGVSPSLGRAFSEAEDVENGAQVVVLSDELWRTRFGADPAILGRMARIDGEAHEVIGVMPAGFAYPSSDTRLWVPLRIDSTTTDGGNFTYTAIARLRDGITPEQAERQLAGEIPRLIERTPDSPDLHAFIEAGAAAPVVHTLKEDTVGELRRPLWILLGTVGFIFLIACANVTNLFLVRAEARQREMAVRAALGARRGTLVGQYLAESALLALLGGVLGSGLGWVGVRALVRAAPPNLPRLDEVAVDAGVLLFTLGVTCMAALLLALLPALRLSAPALLATLGQARGTTAGRERHRARRMLVVLQTALALVLLTGSGLMVRSFQKLRTLDPGFSAEGVLTFRVSLPAASYPTASAASSFHDRVLERLRALPGVTAAGAVSALPLGGSASGTAHDVEDHPTSSGELPPMMWYTQVTPDYYDALRIPIVEGRTLETTDNERTRREVLVSETVARRFWPDGSAVGRRIRPIGDTTGWRTIVGVVGDVRFQQLEEDPAELVYYPMIGPTGDDGTPARAMTYTVRAPEPETLVPAVRREVGVVDPNLPIASVATLERIVADSMVRHSFTALALVIAAAVALMLGAIGLYGVISYLVAQRTREIGLRMALGADAGSVRRMVVLQGVRLSALGLGVGLLGALGLTRLMEGLLYGTSPTDPLTFGAVVVVLAGVALLASWLPARRASLIDPARSLAAE